jgi:NADH-quinone oxidoreductase subunit I
MAVDERTAYEEMRLKKARKMGFGLGLLKGMAVTLKHLFKHNSVIQYPDERQDLSPRTRGVIALKEENCTVCMLCARECPDWCIYIDSHKETLPPKREGGRQRKRNVLDRFAIDYALCMYCGICVEVCPYDALFWSREFEYAEYDIRNLTHEKERLSDWMATVLPPPPLEEGALLPGAPEPELRDPTPPATTRPATATASAVETRPEQEADAPTGPATPEASGVSAAGDVAELSDTSPAQTEAAPVERPVSDNSEVPLADTTEAVEPPAGAEESREHKLTEQEVAQYQESPGPNVEVPHEAPHPVALERTEDPEAVYQQVLQEQKDKGSSPQVAEARAKVARVKAERGIKRGPTPMHVDKPVPSAPTKGQPAEPEPGGAPEAKDIEPDPGPVAPTDGEA